MLFTPEERQRYARHLIRVPEVVAWAWVPVVEAAQRAEFEQAVRDAGWQAPEFRLWDADAAGQEQQADQQGWHLAGAPDDPGSQQRACKCAQRMGEEGEQEVAGLEQRHCSLQTFSRAGVRTCRRWNQLPAEHDQPHVDRATGYQAQHHRQQASQECAHHPLPTRPMMG